MVALSAVFLSLESHRLFEVIDVVAPLPVIGIHRFFEAVIIQKLLKDFIIDRIKTQRQSVFSGIQSDLIDHLPAAGTDRVSKGRLFTDLLHDCESILPYTEMHIGILVPHIEIAG